MELIKTPNRWSCLPTSFAMACRVPVESFLKLIGNDGSEIIRLEEPEPLKRRGFHVQECIYVAYTFGYMTTPFEAEPILTIGRGVDCAITFPNGNRQRMIDLVAGSIGVLTGTTMSGQPHAVAWNGNRVYNPKGEITTIDEFNIQTFWLVRRYSGIA
jgi:hypothetical protein